MYKQQGWQQAWEYSQAKLIQTFVRASQGVDWSWSQCIKSHHTQTSSGKGLPSHFWTRDNVRSILPGLWRKGSGLLLIGPKSSFQMKVNFAFHLEIKVPESVWPTCQTTNHSSFRSASRFGAWKCCHNNKPVCETLGCILKILCRELDIFHILLKIQRLVDPDKRSVITFVNTTAFFFREGVWRHGIFVSRWTENKSDTCVSRKSGLIQPVRWRLRHSWSVSRKVCHMHQTFSQCSVGVTSEATYDITYVKSGKTNNKEIQISV